MQKSSQWNSVYFTVLTGVFLKIFPTDFWFNGSSWQNFGTLMLKHNMAKFLWCFLCRFTGVFCEFSWVGNESFTFKKILDVCVCVCVCVGGWVGGSWVSPTALDYNILLFIYNFILTRHKLPRETRGNFLGLYSFGGTIEKPL